MYCLKASEMVACIAIKEAGVFVRVCPVLLASVCQRGAKVGNRLPNGYVGVAQRSIDVD